jgi:uncharacterized metal-binding protein YceD (DUF177 family)
MMTQPQLPKLFGPTFPKAGLSVQAVPVEWIMTYPGGRIPAIRQSVHYDRLQEADPVYQEETSDGVQADAVFELGFLARTQRFYVVGSVDASVETACSSCYQLFRTTLNLPVEELFVLAHHPASAAEAAFHGPSPGSVRELTPDDWFEEIDPDGSMDLVDLTRQLLLLALHDVPFCPECAGNDVLNELPHNSEAVPEDAPPNRRRAWEDLLDSL